MPYVSGYEPATPTEEPALVGYRLRNGGALLKAHRYGRDYFRRVGPNGSVSLLEASALAHRRDPATGDVRPVHRLTVYEWVRNGKLPTVSRRMRPNTRLVKHVMLPDLWRFIREGRALGYELPPLHDAAGE